MFKFIHAADVHLDSPLHQLDAYEGVPIERFRRATRRAFENLVHLALSEHVSFVLIAGDLFDGDWKDYNSGLYLVSQLKRLNDAGISVVMLAGNHDAASRITKTLRYPENVFLFPTERAATHHLKGVEVAIHGQSFASPAVREDLSRNYPPAVAGCYNIGLLHTCATGREGHERYAPCSVEGLQAKGYDYWALGHVHAYEVLAQDPPVIFAGNIQGRHVRENGPKGCVLATVDGDGRTVFEFRPLDVVRWEVLQVDAGGCASGYEILDRLSHRIADLVASNSDMPLALRVHIRGETGARDEIMSDVERWINEIRSLGIDAGDGQLWVEKVKLELAAPPAFGSIRKADGAMGELLQLFEELQSDAKERLRLMDELNDLQRRLPRELKMDLENGGLEDLLARARPMLVKRLVRKGSRDAG